MSILISDCPRCRSNKITFDVAASQSTEQGEFGLWSFEAFAVCRHCFRATIFRLKEKTALPSSPIRQRGIANVDDTLNNHVHILGFISAKDMQPIDPPEFLPPTISAIFTEAAQCLAVRCFNASGTMFRLCVDLATKGMLPEEDTPGLTSKIKRSLGLRLEWLFKSGRLPESLRELSSCITDDGNDGAHAGTLTELDVTDLLDFTTVLLERLYTEPQRLIQAKSRREARRAPITSS